MNYIKLKVLKLLFRNKTIQLTGFVLTVVYSFVIALIPLISKNMIDSIIASSSISKVYYSLLIFLCISLLQPILGFYKDRLFDNYAIDICKEAQGKLITKLLKCKFVFFEERKLAELYNIFNNDTRLIANYMSRYITNIIKNLFQILLFLSIMAYQSIKISCFIICVIAAIFIINIYYGKKNKNSSYNEKKHHDIVNNAFTQIFKNITLIKTNRLEQDFIFNNKRFIDQHSIILKQISKFKLLNYNINQAIIIMSTALIYYIGFHEVFNNNISIGTVIGLGLYFQMLINPIKEIMQIVSLSYFTLPSIERLDNCYQAEEEFYQKDNIKDIDNCYIKINNLSFRYGIKSGYVLNDVSITFPHKGLVCLTGQSGTGKTTFIKLLLKFYEVYEGSIFLNSYEVRDIPVNVVRNSIAYVSQDTKLFNDSVYKNIKLNSTASLYEVIDTCKKVNIHKKIMELDRGYNTIISESNDLSGGEKQRFAMARLIINQKCINVLDEPTSALDIYNEKLINKLILEVSKNSLVILITHNINLLGSADYIYYFKNGMVIKKYNK